MIDGGHAQNALPQTVHANVNCRMFPGRTADETQAMLAQVMRASNQLNDTQSQIASGKLAVVLGIAAGGVLAGIVGALLAVPLIAFLNNAIRVLVAEDPDAEQALLAEEDGPVIEAKADHPPD